MYTIEDELNIDAGKHVLAMFLNWELFWMNNRAIIIISPKELLGSQTATATLQKEDYLTVQCSWLYWVCYVWIDLNWSPKLWPYSVTA